MLDSLKSLLHACHCLPFEELQKFVDNKREMLEDFWFGADLANQPETIYQLVKFKVLNLCNMLIQSRFVCSLAQYYLITCQYTQGFDVYFQYFTKTKKPEQEPRIVDQVFDYIESAFLQDQRDERIYSKQYVLHNLPVLIDIDPIKTINLLTKILTMNEFIQQEDKFADNYQIKFQILDRYCRNTIQSGAPIQELEQQFFSKHLDLLCTHYPDLVNYYLNNFGQYYNADEAIQIGKRHDLPNVVGYFYLQRRQYDDSLLQYIAVTNRMQSIQPSPGARPHHLFLSPSRQ